MERGELKIQFLLWCIRNGLYVLSFFSMQKAGKWALRLFAKPRRGRLTDKERQFLSSARHASVSSGALTVRYYVWDKPHNSGPAVLLAHGWESNAARWRSLIRYLEKNASRIIALDAPAHGDSGGEVFSAVVYAEFMEAVLKKEPAEVVIGHSAGGMALAFLLYEKSLPSVKKAVLLGVPYNLETILAEYARYVGYSGRVGKAMSEFIESHFGHPVSYYSVEKMAKSMSMPCLIMHDEQDRTTPVEGAKRIHKNWKNSVLKVTKGMGHGLQGAEVYSAIRHWLQDADTQQKGNQSN
jgi:pimeloyl-ACP methyl ester carboxylesterase